MAKFHGVIGFAVTEETRPGVWTNTIKERTYSGDVESTNRRLQSVDQVNDDITISDRISIVADAFANENFHSMRFVEYMGAAWKVTTVDATRRPRLVLTLGGVYNGKRQTRST